MGLSGPWLLKPDTQSKCDHETGIRILVDNNNPKQHDLYQNIIPVLIYELVIFIPLDWGQRMSVPGIGLLCRITGRVDRCSASRAIDRDARISDC